MENFFGKPVRTRKCICDLWRNDRKLYKGFLNSESSKSFSLKGKRHSKNLTDYPQKFALLLFYTLAC